VSALVATGGVRLRSLAPLPPAVLAPSGSGSGNASAPGVPPALVDPSGHLDTTLEFLAADFGGVFAPGTLFRAVAAAPRNACEPFTPHMADAVAGAVVVVERGECPLVNKSRHAQAAGAHGVLFVNLAPTGPAPGVVTALTAAIANRTGAPPTQEHLAALQAAQVFGPFVGSVTAFSDSDDRDIIVPVAMVSAAAGGWLLPLLEQGDVALVVGWEPSHAATRAVWDGLREVRDRSPGYWPTNTTSLRQQLELLLRVHHPKAATVRWGAKGRVWCGVVWCGVVWVGAVCVCVCMCVKWGPGPLHPHVHPIPCVRVCVSRTWLGFAGQCRAQGLPADPCGCIRGCQAAVPGGGGGAGLE
jgi:hypothetical protein